MPPLEESIFLALAGGSPNTNAGQRVYPVQAAQGAALPRVTFQRASTAPSNTLTGNGGNDQVRVQVDCWASSMPGVSALALQVRQLMEAAPFKAQLQGGFDDYEPDTKVFRRSMDFRCWEHLA